MLEGFFCVVIVLFGALFQMLTTLVSEGTDVFTDVYRCDVMLTRTVSADFRPRPYTPWQPSPKIVQTQTRGKQRQKYAII